MARRELGQASVTEGIRDLISGRVEPPLAAALLTAWRMKGETASELAAAALVLREQMTRLVPVAGPVIDTCGTGGDSTGSFNISTAVAFVVSAAGVPVVKHGGRAVSSKSGSADVLRELGLDIEQGPDWAQRCLDRLGFAFCYAPHFHGGLKHLSSLRQILGFRTIFNLLGPLANPAGADFQLMGVGDANLLDPLAGAIAKLNTRRTVLVNAKDGLDEVSLGAPTTVRIVEGDAFRTLEWNPEDFALEATHLTEIEADSPAASAAIIRRVLDNEEIPATRVVVANAAAALWTAEAVSSLKEGVELAKNALKSGAAAARLASIIQFH